MDFQHLQDKKGQWNLLMQWLHFQATKQEVINKSCEF